MIRVEFYSVYREATGKNADEIDAEKISINRLKEMLVKKYPALQKYIQFAIFSINGRYAREDEIVKDGDIVAMFPPIGGG